MIAPAARLERAGRGRAGSLLAAMVFGTVAVAGGCTNDTDRTIPGEVNSPSSTSSTQVPRTSTSAMVPTSASGGPAGQGTVPQPGGTAEGADSGGNGTAGMSSGVPATSSP